MLPERVHGWISVTRLVAAGAVATASCVGDRPPVITSPTALELSDGSTEVLVGAGDIASCTRSSDEATARLLDGIEGTVFTAGDNAYPDASADEYRLCYDSTWGRHRARTRPSPGNHDYYQPGAGPYYTYFGANAGDSGKGYYSYDLGAWHVVSLNSSRSMSAGSTQERWLRADLAASAKRCTIAYWHHARFSSGRHGSDARSQGVWEALYEAGAEVVIVAHDHLYERFAPVTPGGVRDDAHGIRQFVVGTGGAGLYSIDAPIAHSEVQSTSTHGVLKLTLSADSYAWEFVPVAGESFRDVGSGFCHDAREPGDSSSDLALIVAAGNIATCGTSNDEATARLLDEIPGTVLTLGDHTVHGAVTEYADCYGPSWGRHRDRTRAVLGDHDYDPGTGDATWDYFGDRAGPVGQGYYSFGLGDWHVIVLNDEIPFNAGSEQDQWLQQDLAGNAQRCTLAAWHSPRFFSSNIAGWTSTSSRRILWDRLYAAGVDVVLNANQYTYERLAPMAPDGAPDATRGIRSFNVGTGGKSVTLYSGAIHPQSEVRGAAFGVLKLTLSTTTYAWEFKSVDGSFSDSGQTDCH